MPELKKEQLDVINHEKGNILISASAGSGKTFVMIERLIRLISEGKTSVKNVLCVTFTEAAAFEMKEKLKKALIEKIPKNPNLAEEVLLVETADTCTIHAFCSRLIRKYFFTAEVSPDFSVADESKAELLIKESIDEVFSSLYKEQNADFLYLLKRHGKYRSDKAFKSLITDTYKFLQVDANPNEYIENALSIFSDVNLASEKYKNYLLITLKNLLQYSNELYNTAKRLDFENAKAILSKIIDDINTVIAGNLYAFKNFEGYKLSLQFGRGLNEEQKALREEVKCVYLKLQGVFKRVNEHISNSEEDAKKGLEIKAHLQKIFRVVEVFDKTYSLKKREENLLDFADLEHFALKILKDDEIRSAVTDTYRYVFADEYQDVNGVQEEILSLVSVDNLFMVGDVKQSIYGFRGCRPEIFEEKERKMQLAGEKTVRLNHNFRSSKGVIDAVNEIFSFSMTESLYGTEYYSTAKLIGGGIYPDYAVGQTSLYLLNKENNEKQECAPKVYDLLDDAVVNKEDYPSNIALLIEKIIREELTKKFYDTKLKKERYVTYSDIVILNKNRDNDYVFSLVSGLLRLNIPVSSEVSENVLVYPEIQLLISVLKLIDCMAEDIPLVSVMKSPVGNFTEEELLRISIFYKDYLSALELEKRRERNFFSAYKYALENMSGEIGEKLKKFDGYVCRLRFQADFLGAGKILEKIVQESALEQFIVAKGKGEEKLKRISFFLNKAVEDKTYTVHEFLNLIEKSPKNFLVSPSAGGDSVKLMTIHASKGLEFPVVIVCGLEKATNRRAQSDEVLKDYQLGLCLKNYDDVNKVFEENLFRGLFKEKMRIEKIKEDLRLFYVATTRASYSMHLTFESKKEIRRNYFIGADKFIDYLPLSMEANEVDVETLYKKAEERKDKRKVLVGSVDQKEREKIRKNLEFIYPFEDCTTLPIKCSVTKAVNQVKEEVSPIHVINVGEETGAERGVIAHKILENLDFNLLNDHFDFTNQVDNLIKVGVLSSEEVDKINLERLKNAVMSFSYRVKGKTLYREQPFLAKIDSEKVLNRAGDKILVQGVIDLLALDGDAAEIIDYKYSTLNANSLKKKYSSQLELYALAVEEVLGLKVTKKTLVNVFSGESIDF